MTPPRPGIGQRAMWTGYDVGLGLAFMATAGDIPFHWGLSPLCWAVIYALAVLRILTVWRDYGRVLAQNWTYLLYPAAVIASISWSVSRGVTIIGSVQITMSVLIACYFGWRFAPRQLMMLLFTTIGLGTMASLLNLWVGAFGGARFSDVGGLLGIYANKNTLGHTSLLLMPVAMTLMMLPKDQVPFMFRRAAPLMLVFGALAVVASKSMTAVVLMPFYMFLMLLLNRRRLPATLRHGTMMAIVAMAALIPVSLTLAGTDPMAILLATTGKDATLTGRTELWNIASAEFVKVPLTGYGFGAFWQAPQFSAQRYEVVRAGATASAFHHVFVDTAIGTGLFGIGAMLALMMTSIRRTLRFWWRDGGTLAVGCLVTVLLPIGLSMMEPYLYRQHEIMAAWLIMIGVSLQQRPNLIPPLRKGTT